MRRGLRNAYNSLGSLVIVVNISALVLANVQAYKARNISDHLSESKYNGIASFSMFQMFIIGVPGTYLSLSSIWKRSSCDETMST